MHRATRLLLSAYGPVLGVVLAVAALKLTGVIEPEVLYDDPAAQAGLPPYLGALSHAGVLLWAMAGAACALAASLVPAHRRHLATAAAALLLLALDDLFLIHESLALVGLPDAATFAGYGLVLGALAWRGRALLAAGDERWLLLSGVSALAASAAIDVLPAGWQLHDVVEDMVKLVGIVGVTTGMALVARQAIVTAAARQPPHSATEPHRAIDLTDHHGDDRRAPEPRGGMVRRSR